MAWTWRYGEGTEEAILQSGMSGRYCGLSLGMVSFRRRMCQIQSLPRAFETACIPLGPEDLSWWKTYLSVDSAPVHTARTTQWQIGCLIRRTWTCWTLLSDTFCRRKSWRRLTLIWTPYIRTSLRNGASEQRNTSARPAPIPLPPARCRYEKWRVFSL